MLAGDTRIGAEVRLGSLKPELRERVKGHDWRGFRSTMACAVGLRADLRAMKMRRTSAGLVGRCVALVALGAGLVIAGPAGAYQGGVPKDEAKVAELVSALTAAGANICSNIPEGPDGNESYGYRYLRIRVDVPCGDGVTGPDPNDPDLLDDQASIRINFYSSRNVFRRGASGWKDGFGEVLLAWTWRRTVVVVHPGAHPDAIAKIADVMKDLKAKKIVDNR